jgi:hypothetical protein
MRRHINAQRGREKLNHAVKALNTINMFAVKLNEAELDAEKSEEGEARTLHITHRTVVLNLFWVATHFFENSILATH